MGAQFFQAPVIRANLTMRFFAGRLPGEMNHEVRHIQEEGVVFIVTHEINAVFGN